MMPKNLVNDMIPKMIEHWLEGGTLIYVIYIHTHQAIIRGLRTS